MTTVHFRQGTRVIALPEQPTTTIPALIAELAEVLVSSQLASQEEVGELRLAVLNGNSWEEVSQSTETLETLQITNDSVVGYTFGNGDFAFEEYV